MILAFCFVFIHEKKSKDSNFCSLMIRKSNASVSFLFIHEKKESRLSATFSSPIKMKRAPIRRD